MRANTFRLSGALYEAGSWYDQSKSIYRAMLRVSRDEGKSWIQFLLSEVTSAAYSVVPHPTNDNIIYVGGEEADASGSTYPMLLKTTNGGASWTRIALSITTYSGDRFQILEIDKRNPNKLLAGNYNRLYISTDGGGTWGSVSAFYSPRCLVMDPANSDNIYVGCYDGVYSSSNGGSSWADISGNIGCRYIKTIKYNTQNQVLYLGTMYGGVYRRLLNPTVGVEVASMPAEFKLFQNYPNPFNPSTTISYHLPARLSDGLTAVSVVKLELFDVIGRKVATLDQGMLEPGYHTVRWDASGFPSGVYLSQLQAGSFRQSRRMVLMK